MQHLLNQLAVVVTELQNHHFSHLCRTNDKNQTAAFMESLNKQVTEHKNELMAISLQNLSKKKAKQLVKLYQPGIIKILNTLHQSPGTCKDEWKCKSCTMRQALDIITDLLCFLREQFPFAFNQNITVPASISESHTVKIRNARKSINQALQEKEAGKALTKNLLHPLSDFLANNQECTFCDLSYLHTWTFKLSEMSRCRYTDKQLDKLLGKAAIENDLNSTNCINCLEALITREYQSKPDTTNQLIILNYYLKCVNQISVTTGICYDPSRDSLKSSLSNWLVEEILFIEKKCQSYQEVIQMKQPAQVATSKLTLTLSVPMIAIFIRALIENNYLAKAPKSEIFRFFSNHFSSVQSEVISENNLKNEYYELDPAAIKAFKEVVLELLKWVQKL